MPKLDTSHSAAAARPFAYKVLDELTVNMSREYVRMLGQLNTAIAKVLGTASDASKSDGLVVIDGELSKAYPLGGQAAGVVRPDVSDAGSRGGKWWRDKHGHVRYGLRPGEDGGADRDWQEVPEDEVKQLYTSLEAVYEYSPELRDVLVGVLNELGYSPEQLLNVIRGARSYGQSTEQYFVDTASLSGASAEDAANAFSKIIGTFKDALTDPTLQVASQRAVDRRAIAEASLQRDIEHSKSYCEGFLRELMTGDVSAASMKVLALMADLQMLYIPHSVREIGGNRIEAYEKIGRITPNDQILATMRGLLDNLSPEQLAALFLAERFSEINSSSDPRASAAIAFKDPETGTFSKEVLDSKKANLLFYIKDAIQGVVGHKLSVAEYDSSIRRLNEVGFYVNSYLHAFNADQGGEAVGLIFGGQFSAKSLFESPDSVARIEKGVLERRALIKKALAAQKDDKLETPYVMRTGFAAVSEIMHSKGELDEDKQADLLKHQRQAINWALAIKHGILAFDTGCGKTQISIALSAILKEAGLVERSIIVLPKGLVKQWPDQIKLFYPGAVVQHIKEGATLEDRLELIKSIQAGHIKCDFLLMSCSTMGLSRYSRAALHKSGVVQEVPDPATGKTKWVRRREIPEDEYLNVLREIAHSDNLVKELSKLNGVVFFDEAHHETQGLKEPTNIHSVVARDFLHGRPYAYMLTATPIPNGRPEDLFHLMDLIHSGSAGPDVVRFSNKIAHYEPVLDEATGNIDIHHVSDDNWEDASKDVSPYVFFKKKTDPEVVEETKRAGLRFPGHVVETHNLTIPPALQDLFKQSGDIKPHYVLPNKWVPKANLSLFGSSLRTIHQLQQLSVSPKLILGDSYEGPQPKIEHARRLVLAHFNEGGNSDHPVIIASQWPSAFKYMQADLVDHGVDQSLIKIIDGSVPSDERDAIQEAVNSGAVKVLLLGTQAGGAGLNLQKKANKIIFLDQPWAPHHKSQTIGRVDRPGRAPSDPIKVIDLLLSGSVDDQKLAKLRDKLSTIETLSYAKDGGTVAAKAVMASLVDMLGGESALASSTPDQIERSLVDLGVADIVAPDVLKTSFDMKKFSETIDFGRYLKFGHDEIEAARAINTAKFKNGKITSEMYKAAASRLNKQEHTWVRALKVAGSANVAVDRPVSIQPERQFALISDQLPEGKDADVSATARSVFNIMQVHPGKMTVTDFMDQHYRPLLTASASTPEEAKDLDVKWWKYNDDLKTTVQNAFKELQRVGVLGVHHETDQFAKVPEQKEVPKPELDPKKSGPSFKAEGNE